MKIKKIFWMFIVHKFKYIRFLLSGIVVISVCLHAISITYLYLFGFFLFRHKEKINWLIYKLFDGLQYRFPFFVPIVLLVSFHIYKDLTIASKICNTPSLGACSLYVGMDLQHAIILKTQWHNPLRAVISLIDSLVFYVVSAVFHP